MTWHFLEVWGVLLVAFAAGCVLGTLLYIALAASPLARLQAATADAIGATAGGFRTRLGLSREPAVPFRRAADHPRPEAFASHSSAGYEAVRAAEWHADEPLDQAVAAIDEALDEEDPGWEGEAYWDGEADDVNHAVEASRAPAAGAVATPSPRTARAPEPAPEVPAMRPLTLPGPRNGVPDNLQRIRGIGQKNEELLNSLGIYHFGQIAAWTPAEARWVANHLAFPERLERDDWVGQAIILATGGDTGYIKAAERRKGLDETPTADAAP